jgi:hypothetical protein
MEFRHVFTRATEARLGITYRFAGWTETPGFFTVPAAIPPASP